MKRLTTDDVNSILFGLNLFFVKDNEVWIRCGGPDPDYQDCTLTDWINRAAAAQGIELDADDPESMGDIMYDCLQYGADTTEGILALLHAAAVQAAEMRSRLASIENILGDKYTLDHVRNLIQVDGQTRWVHCDTQMPEPGVRVLVCCGDFVCEAYCDINGYFHRIPQEKLPGEDSLYPITHWMPLPDPPKQEE